MRGLNIMALILTIIGALNWGLVGLFDFDLVASIFGGADATISTVIYVLIGLAGIINLSLLFEMINETDRR
ncbi:MAG TPA: DUF378 domain-containing protein [Mollicutes bacterium]|jgi:uncharacterized membrane protein YuzA (DUF378 family)|nr:DUF378 domain-containing protein [Mollicutes bacterium]